jgi:hypothetical protein
MKLLLGLVLAWVFLGGAAANAAPCDAGSTPDQDGCQTTTPPNPQGDWQIMAFHICEEKSTGDACPIPASGSVADPEFDLIEDAVGIPKTIQFSVEDANTCTAGAIEIIGRNVAGGDDHLYGTLQVGATGDTASVCTDECVRCFGRVRGGHAERPHGPVLHQGS